MHGVTPLMRAAQAAHDDACHVLLERAAHSSDAARAALLAATELGPDGIGGLTIDIREHDYQQVAIACAPRVGRAHAGVAYERFTREGPLALLPLREGRAGLVWTLAPEAGARVHALSDDEFCDAMTRAAGHWLAPFSDPGQRGMFPLRLRTGVLQDYSARALLLGGAAVQLHPVAGQGLNLALRDIAALADLVAGVSRDGSDLGDKTLRGQFERARRADRSARSGAASRSGPSWRGSKGPARRSRETGRLQPRSTPRSETPCRRTSGPRW